MAKYRFDKLFNRGEANELIPRLEILVRELQLQANTLTRRLNELARVEDGLARLELPALIERHPELGPLAARMAEVAAEIESMGCFLKDIDQGLVDFPFRVGKEGDEDDIAFLCWQFGEPCLIAWHPIEGGFAQRRPLPGARKQLLN